MKYLGGKNRKFKQPNQTYDLIDFYQMLYPATPEEKVSKYTCRFYQIIK